MKLNEHPVVSEFLVMQCQAGDRKALSALVAKWQPSFLRYATLLARDPDLAADILQDAWIKIIRALPGLRDPMRFNTWAYRIINNQCMDALRSTRPEDQTPPSEKISTPIANFEDRELVWSILAELTTEHRSVLALHYLQGFEIADIARIVRVPEGTVKSRLHHAREKFRVLMEQQANPQTDEKPAAPKINQSLTDGEHNDDAGTERPRERQPGQPDQGSAGVCYRPA